MTPERAIGIAVYTHAVEEVGQAGGPAAPGSRAA